MSKFMFWLEDFVISKTCKKFITKSQNSQRQITEKDIDT